MSNPPTPPRLVKDARGRVRMKLKRGVGDEDHPEGPHVHYFTSAGARVDSTGRPLEARARQNFRPIRWDLPEEAPSGSASATPDVDLALGLLRRSPTFRTALEATLRAGWAIELAAPAFGVGARKGTRTISLDTSKRSAFVARLARDVALARAHEEPVVWTDAAAPNFVHLTTLAFMRLWASAALVQARVRDEILVAGGPDIGGPGLRGMQLEAYDTSMRQTVARERVVDAVAFSVDGELAQRFNPSVGPRLAGAITEAFLPPKTLIVGTGLSSDMLGVLEAVRDLPTLDAFHVGKLFEVELAPRPLAVETPYVDALAALLPHGPFSWVELRAPVPAAQHLAPRVVLVPRYEMSHFDLHAWFGLGAPWDIDLTDKGFATAVYPGERRRMFVTYRADAERALSSFAFGES